MVAVVIVIIAWVVGTYRAEADLAPFLEQAMPEADRFTPVTLETYAAWKSGQVETLIGYVTTGKAHGYAGEITMAVAVSLSGAVEGLAVVEHKETSSFFRRVMRSDLQQSLRGKSYDHAFSLGQDVDGITGATYSARALAEAVRQDRPVPRTGGLSRGPLCAAMVRVGELLVAAGERLRERYTPAVVEPCCRLEVEYG